MTTSMSKAPSSTRSLNGLSPLARTYSSALLLGDRHAAARCILGAVEDGTSVKSVYIDVFQPVQYRVGELWQTGRIGVPKNITARP